jgi:hypothetical protein
MIRRRPCRICRRWFQPHPRAGDRQRVCSGEACQRERHRRACASWHERHPGYDRGERLRQRITEGVEVRKVAFGSAPEARLAWDAVRDAVGMEVAVVVEESAKVLGEAVRDAVGWQPLGIMKESRKVMPERTRDEIAGGGPGP